MTAHNKPPVPPLSACYCEGAGWFRNELLPDEGARFTLGADFAQSNLSAVTTVLYPPAQAEGAVRGGLKPLPRRVTRLIDVLTEVMHSWTLGSLNRPDWFAGLGASECAPLYGQARMCHLIALQKLWNTDTPMSSTLRDLIDSGAWLYAFGSIFWGRGAGKEGLCVPVTFRLAPTDPRMVLSFKYVDDDLLPNDHALGAPLNLRYY